MQKGPSRTFHIRVIFPSKLPCSCYLIHDNKICPPITLLPPLFCFRLTCFPVCQSCLILYQWLSKANTTFDKSFLNSCSVHMNGDHLKPGHNGLQSGCLLQPTPTPQAEDTGVLSSVSRRWLFCERKACSADWHFVIWKARRRSWVVKSIIAYCQGIGVHSEPLGCQVKSWRASRWGLEYR